MATFKESLSVGEQVELIILPEIRKTRPNAYKVEGYHPDYDIIDPDSDETYEVKFERYALHSDRFVVECANDRNNGGKFKPSGIASSKANWIIFSDSTELIVVSRQDLLDFIKSKPPIKKGFGFWSYEFKRFVGKGDDYVKAAYFVGVGYLRKLSRKNYSFDFSLS